MAVVDVVGAIKEVRGVVVEGHPVILGVWGQVGEDGDECIVKRGCLGEYLRGREGLIVQGGVEVGYGDGDVPILEPGYVVDESLLKVILERHDLRGDTLIVLSADHVDHRYCLNEKTCACCCSQLVFTSEFQEGSAALDVILPRGKGTLTTAG